MHKRSYYIINAITMYRLAAAPVLAILALDHRPGPFKWLLAASFFTDAIDGYLSRRFKVTSIMGSRLDSIADDCTILAAMVGLLIFRPGFIRQELVFFGVLLGLFVLQTSMALMRYGKTTSFHTYMAKTAAIMQGICFLLIFFLPDPPYVIFYTAAIITMLELAEEIILVMVLRHWQADVKGLYWVIKKQEKKS